MGLAFHERQHGQRPHENDQQSGDPFGVFQEHRRYGQGTLQMMETLLHFALVAVLGQHQRRRVFAFRQIRLQHKHAFQFLQAFQFRLVDLPGQGELAVRDGQRVREKFAFAVLAARLFQTPPDRFLGLQAVLAEDLLGRANRRGYWSDGVPGGRLPLGLGRAVHKNQPIVHAHLAALEDADDLVRHFARLVPVAVFRVFVGVGLRTVSDRLELVLHFAEACLQRLREFPDLYAMKAFVSTTSLPFIVDAFKFTGYRCLHLFGFLRRQCSN